VESGSRGLWEARLSVIAAIICPIGRIVAKLHAKIADTSIRQQRARLPRNKCDGFRKGSTHPTACATGTRIASTRKFGMFGRRVIDLDLNGWKSIHQLDRRSARTFSGGKDRFRVAIDNDCESFERKVVQTMMHGMKSLWSDLA